jgi:hypothetical protein
MIALAVNGIAFPIGFLFCIWYSKPVVRLLRQGVNTATKDNIASARLRAFQLSRFVTVLGITEWLIAGMMYPIALNVLTEGLATKWYFHFVGSLLICGLVAAAYPFFMTATLTIKSFLPSLLQSDRLRAADVAQLHRLSEQSTWSLYLAGGVPAVGMMILLMTQQQTTTENSSFALTALSIVGAVGFALILSLSKSLQSDIEALLEAARLVGQDED